MYTDADMQTAAEQGRAALADEIARGVDPLGCIPAGRAAGYFPPDPGRRGLWSAFMLGYELAREEAASSPTK